MPASASSHHNSDDIDGGPLRGGKHLGMLHHRQHTGILGNGLVALLQVRHIHATAFVVRMRAAIVFGQLSTHSIGGDNLLGDEAVVGDEDLPGLRVFEDAGDRELDLLGAVVASKRKPCTYWGSAIGGSGAILSSASPVWSLISSWIQAGTVA